MVTAFSPIKIIVAGYLLLDVPIKAGKVLTCK